MDGAGSDTRDFSHPVESVETTRTNNTFRRNLILSAAGVAAVAGLAAPVVYFAAFSSAEETNQLPVAAVETPEKVAALVMPAPKRVTIQKITTTAPRSDRLEAAAAEAALKLLTPDDPRWARAGAEASEALPESLQTAELRAKLEQLRDNAKPRSTEVATAQPVGDANSGTDATLTGTIPSRPAEEPKQAKIEAAAVKAEERASTGEQMAAISTPQSPQVAAAAEPSRDELQTVQVKTHVNMRAGPENEAAVLTVLPTGTDVKLIGCDMWCEVDFEGKRGFVYKSFISGS